MGRNPSDERRVLLRMREGEHRRVLGKWLASEPGYLPIVADSNEAFNAEFDCVIVDTETLRQAGDDLSARRRMEPVFLPVLLLRSKPSSAGELGTLDQLPEHIRDCVDDTIRTPIREPTLERRLETLMQARRYADQLIRSRDRYYRLLELLPEAVLLLNNGQLVYVNEAGIQLLGREEPELIGSHPTLFVDQADRHTLARFLYALAEGRAEDSVRVTIPVDGVPVPVEFRGVRLYEEGEDESPLLQLLVRDLRTVEEALEPR
ncbi:MAG: PAS domain-containing protein [Halolamina sp.]|uniref:PAS domain-containing protein n=1 Tax=Halolamina sp. TaxID=1940283 RepID=UPI002FC39ABB